MKIISLNTWGGRVKEPFIDFVKKYNNTDIFCFQEIYDNAEEIMKRHYPEDSFNIFSELKELLPNHNGFFRPVLQGVYGLAIFIKKEILLLEEGEIFIHRSDSKLVTDGHHSRNLQWVKFSFKNELFTVMNVHGLWNGKGKTDTPERIAQSNLIKEFVNKAEGKKILVGDFNLNPDTESVRILAKDMKNLIEEYSIVSTRTSLYKRPGKFADYIFVSPDVDVNNFTVLPDEVSDHAALSLELKLV